MNRLYADRKKRGRGLRNIEDMYEARYTELMKNLEEGTNENTLLELVSISEKEDILRLGKELEKRLHDIHWKRYRENEKRTGKEMERESYPWILAETNTRRRLHRPESNPKIAKTEINIARRGIRQGCPRTRD